MAEPKYRSIKGVMANLADSLEKERDELLTENRTLRSIIHGLHKPDCICWVCERCTPDTKASGGADGG